jgi:hypothetical protein
MVKIRMMLGLEVTLDTRLDLLRKFITEYEKICKVCDFYPELLCSELID